MFVVKASSNGNIIFSTANQSHQTTDTFSSGSATLDDIEPTTLSSGQNQFTSASLFFENPVGDRLSKESSFEISSIIIHNLKGSIVSTSNSNIVNTSLLVKGVYMALVNEIGGQKTIIKILKN